MNLNMDIGHLGFANSIDTIDFPDNFKGAFDSPVYSREIFNGPGESGYGY